MRTLQFKLWLLMFLSSATLLAQKENIYSKNFKTDKNTTALLKLKGGTVKIESSPDENFYVEYNVVFDNYPKRKKKGIIEKIEIEAQMSDNHITLVDKSKIYFNARLNAMLGNLYKKDTSIVKNHNKKSKQDLIEEIKEIRTPVSFYEELIKNSSRYSPKEKEELINKFNNRKKRSYNKSFIIKIPTNIELTIDAKNTIIRLTNNLENKLSVRLDGGKFIAKSLNNNSNVIKVKDALFLTENINGGEFALNNIKKGLIGSINNINLLAEFSNLEIGEVQQNNNFKGFSNDILIHNFSNNFNQFDLFLEYSKIHFFKLSHDYELNAIGYNTLVNIDNIIGKVAPQKSDKKEKFFVKERSGKGLFSGIMNFDLTHSFINIH
ncbi:hypothetical protein [Jejuia spongiicola]|uniref:DUF4097 family beta strand repeat protein n=1 Tax=Jejuia spongiicola TaxID=2942207 RepID=A0ABT0Q9F6_9FLAO|nr:hypothetical protein [Jejuia spongiicola]MCL6293591.1 hypothetical protein [Jejuia spongiicola]